MKTKRQTKMLELIKKHDIETQEELSDYLQKEGRLTRRRLQGRSLNVRRRLSPLSDIRRTQRSQILWQI